MLGKYSKPRVLFINAFNIHNGGGSVLLKALIDEIAAEKNPKYFFHLVLDPRFQLKKFSRENVKVTLISPNFYERFLNQIWMYRIVGKDDVVLMFGNLPPLFKLKGKTFVFLQNKLILSKLHMTNLVTYTGIKLFFLKIWFYLAFKNTNLFIVQTLQMKLLLNQLIKNKRKIFIAPFFVSNLLKNNLRGAAKKKYDFIYVASGEKHKNHRLLIDAWRLLAAEGIRPSLCLTLSEVHFKNLKIGNELNITNFDRLSHCDISVLYSKSKALIYPSLIESFGLPLAEAKSAGLKIVASETDYVRDLFDPDFTFDNTSALSISRAVKRSLNIPCSRDDILSPAQYLSFIKDISFE